LAKSVEVTLVVRVAVDDEYPGMDHANDIVSTARKTFPTADIDVLAIEIASEDALADPRPGPPA